MHDQFIIYDPNKENIVFCLIKMNELSFISRNMNNLNPDEIWQLSALKTTVDAMYL